MEPTSAVSYAWMVLKIMCFKNILVFILLSVLMSASNAKQFSSFNSDVATWIENPPPADKKSFAWHNWKFGATHAELMWKVTLVDGKVVAEIKNLPYDYADLKPPFEPKIPQRYKKSVKTRSFPVEDGWFVAFNDKKIGSELWWYSDSGLERYKVADAYVTDLIYQEGDVYVLDAFYFNVSPPKGSFQKVSKDKSGIWRLKKIVATQMLPLSVYAMPSGDFVIADYPSTLLKIDKNFHVTELLGMNDIHLTLPYSMVAKPSSGYVYIGTSQYVVEVNLDSKKVRYLVPSSEFIEYKVDEASREFFDKR